MNLQCLEIANKCNTIVAAHMQMAAFMRKIGDIKSMRDFIDYAMEWAIHADLMMHEAFSENTPNE